MRSVCLKAPQESIKKLQETKSNFRKVLGCEVNIKKKKSNVFLYPDNGQIKTKNKKKKCFLLKPAPMRNI